MQSVTGLEKQMVKSMQSPWLPTLHHKDIPRYVNPHDSMVKAIERGRWHLMSNNQKLAYGKTNLIGALVRFEPAFQHHDDHMHFKNPPEADLLGAIGTVIEGEWTINRNGVAPGQDFWFRDIFWYEFGYSKQTEWLSKTIRVIALANGNEDDSR